MRTNASLAMLVLATATIFAGAESASDFGTCDFRPDAAAHKATNPAQGFDAWIGADGVRVRPHDGGWELELALVRVGRDGALEEVEASGVEAHEERAEIRRGGLVEWFINHSRGLEHGFTLTKRPAGDGPLVLELEISGDLLALSEPDEQSVTLMRPGSPLAVLHYGGLEVFDRDGNALSAWLSPSAVDSTVLRIVVEDHGAAYPLIVDPLLTTAAWNSADSDLTWIVAWGDWDGDGDLDLAAGNQGQPNRVYENTGGGLTSAWISVDADDTFSVSWGDWDSDGDLDLAVGNHGQPNRVYDNTGGTLATTAVWTSADSDSTRSVAWGDWDSDRDLDLAAGNQGQPNRVYDNTGGALTSAWTSVEADDTFSVSWGDWDSDDDLDLATGNAEPNRIYQNTGGTLATTAAWSSADSDISFTVVWGDWDGDGDLDLAAGNAGPNRVYENTGGSLSSAWTSAEIDHTRSVAWGDWDGDGDLDLSAGNQGQPNRVYENTGGALSSAWTSAESGLSLNLAWGDWDGDGDLDLAAGNLGPGPTIRVYENTGGSLSLAWSTTYSYATASVAWGDWDSDGDLDLAAGNYGPNRVYENTGGGLVPVWTSSLSDAAETRSVAWGDWDGDGDLDLAAGNGSDHGIYRPNRVYENTGGALVLAWTSAESGRTNSVAWGDWDGDGDLDLAAGNFDDMGAPNRVYENTGGSLTEAWTSPEREWTYSVAWGDWDSDGDLELAVANPILGPSRVYENTGGTLTSAWTSNDGAASVAWGDWDSDGDLDLAAGTGGSNRVYKNNGGTLSLAWTSADSEQTYAVAWGDWDADGDLDLGAGGHDIPYRVYENGFLNRPGLLPETPVSPVIAERPGLLPTDSAFFFSASRALSFPVYAEYVLVDDQSDPARLIVPEYSLVEGGPWHPATEAPGGSGTEDLASQPGGLRHLFVWDNFADGVFRSDSVSFRITVPHQASTRVAGPIQRAAMSAVSPPFRIHVAAADVSITKDNAQNQAIPGQPATYTITASNIGPDDAADARVTDVFPAELSGVTWTCAFTGAASCENTSGAGDIDELVSLPAGDTVTFTATGTVDPGATGLLSNTAMVQIAAGMTDIDESNNTATDIDTLTPEVDLVITKGNNGSSAIPGLLVTYAITAANPGPSSVIGATVTDVFPAELPSVTWTCAGAAGGSCTASGSGDILDTVDLPAGGSVTYTASAILDRGATGTMANTADVTCPADVHERQPADNTATDTDGILTVLFADGFDTGDTTAWSSTVGGP